MRCKICNKIVPSSPDGYANHMRTHGVFMARALRPAASKSDQEYRNYRTERAEQACRNGQPTRSGKRVLGRGV